MLNQTVFDEKIENLTSRILELEQENTNLRMLDETISRNTAMFEALIANSPSGIALTGPDRRIIRVMQPAFGFSNSEVLGLPLESLMHPEDQPILVDCYNELLSGREKIVEFEGRICREDGSPHWVMAKFTDMLDDPNVQAIVCNYADVTQRKQQEIIQVEFAALAESAERVIFSMDIQGRILTWNPGAASLYGYSVEEIAGQHIRILVPPELQEEERSARERIRETADTLELPTIRLCKDNSRVSLLVWLAPGLDRYGRAHWISQSSVAR